MLEAVGHPVAVNPDRVLAKVAREREWEVMQFTKPVRLRDRVSVPSLPMTATAAGVTAVATAGALVAWRLTRRARTLILGDGAGDPGPRTQPDAAPDGRDDLGTGVRKRVGRGATRPPATPRPRRGGGGRSGSAGGSLRRSGAAGRPRRRGR